MSSILHALTRRVPSRVQLIRIVWLLAALAIGSQARGGADYGRYAQWPKAFESSNILKIQSQVLSPVGVPVTHWSHAPGLIADALERTAGLVPAVRVGLHTAAWLAAIVFWWAMIGLVRLATRGDPALLVLSLAAAFIATHAGFYSIYHSSEIFSLATVAVSAFWALSAPPERVRDSLIIGIACGLMLIVRVNQAVYVLLPLAARAVVIWNGSGKRLNRALLLHALAFGVPVLVYGAQLLLFNYWMTGSPSRSPYQYGDGNFRSLDPAHPMFGTMLFHSWHGLLTYHPLFALGAVALVALILRKDSPLNERLLAGVGLFALLAQLYLQASWWCWWVGTGTFGNRTLAPSGAVLVVALARWLFLLQRSATRKALTIAISALSITAICCFWSLLLYLQGQSNYVTWRDLLHEQWLLARTPDVFVPVCIALALCAGFCLVCFGTLRSRALFIAFAAFVASLATQGLLTELVRGWASELGLSHAVIMLGLVSACTFAVVCYLATDGQESPPPLGLARTAVAGGLLCVFVAGSWSFKKLAVETKNVIANSTAKPRNYRYRAAMVMDDALESLPEYDRVEGFEARKRAAREFIEAAAAEARRRLTHPGDENGKPPS